MKMKKFLASVLAALMAVSSMSFIASAQETSEETPATVTITFDRQNGAFKKTTSDESMYAVTTANVAVGETVKFPAEGEYIYHTFKGWSTEKNGTVIEDLSAVTATEATTYYGVWEWNLAKGTPVESMYAHNEESKMATENGKSGGVWYDATTGSVYKRFLNVAGKNPVRCNMYSSIKYSLPGSELHMVALVRTNLTEGKNTSVGIHNSSKKSGTSFSGSLTSKNNFSEEDVDKWKIVYLSDNNFADFGVGTHVDFNVTGDAPANDIENDYFDVAGLALFGTSEEVQAFDIEAATAYDGEAVVYFDAQITEDDDTDVYTEYPTNLKNEGNALVGWTLDPTAEEIEYVDLTKVPVPTADVTYYAVWNEERTINFYKNDGTDTVETLTLGKGAPVEAPEFTADGKKFLGWSETADGEIVEVQATAEESKDYYAIWLNNWLTRVVVNNNDYGVNVKDGVETISTWEYISGKWYGIEDLATAQRLDFVMPYGYPTSIVPTIVPTAANGEAVYNAPATFDGEGSIVMGEITIPVTFKVADRDSVKDMRIVPSDTVNAGGRGAKPFKNNEDKGISALKVVPIYTNESDYYEAGDFSFDRQAVVYEAHHDEVVASGVKYYTYGKYDTLREEYTIEIKVKGAKINLGAFGIAFNESYMTFDPNAQDSVTMADGIANYLDIVINNTKEGYAFGWDGSSTSEGYVDASENEVLIATIKTKMTAEQRAAFENAGKTMSLYDASNIEEDISKYYDGENYLVSVYVGGLATPKLATKYEGHSDEVLEVTEANVEVTVNFTSKLGETKANIAYIKLGDEVTALETAGNAETSATKTYEYLKVGQSYKIRVEKNGYLAAEVDYTVAAGDNKIVINLIAGDIKGAETATCGDGTIDLSDFVRLIRAFDVDSTQTFKDAVDIDENGAVNVSDLAIIKANYNKTSAETVITYNGEEAAG